MPLYVFTPNDLGRSFCAQGNDVFTSFAADDISTLLEDTFAPNILQTATFNTETPPNSNMGHAHLVATFPSGGPTRAIVVGTLRKVETPPAP